MLSLWLVWTTHFRTLTSSSSQSKRKVMQVKLEVHHYHYLSRNNPSATGLDPILYLHHYPCIKQAISINSKNIINSNKLQFHITIQSIKYCINLLFIIWWGILFVKTWLLQQLQMMKCTKEFLTVVTLAEILPHNNHPWCSQ